MSDDNGGPMVKRDRPPEAPSRLPAIDDPVPAPAGAIPDPTPPHPPVDPVKEAKSVLTRERSRKLETCKREIQEALARHGCEMVSRTSGEIGPDGVVRFAVAWLVIPKEKD